MTMIPLGTIVKFNDQYSPRENDREGIVTEHTADRLHKVEWTALGAIPSCCGFYEAWQLAAVTPPAEEKFKELQDTREALGRVHEALDGAGHFGHHNNCELCASNLGAVYVLRWHHLHEKAVQS